MHIEAFFDEATSTLTYVVYDEASGDALIVDPVLDFDPLRWRTSEASVERLVAWVGDRGLRVHWVLDTHVHADHLTGTAALAARLGARTAIGAAITSVQRTFAAAFGLEGFPCDGRQWDALLHDGQVLEAGALRLTVLHAPGHTPACCCYLVGDALFTGDVLFMPDFGTGRCDFPGGSADALYASIHDTVYALPDETRVFVGHDYQPGGRDLRYETTVGASKAANAHLRAATTREEFVAFRTARDARLTPPKLILPSLQVNIRAGELPPPEPDGRRYLRIPLDVL